MKRSITCLLTLALLLGCCWVISLPAQAETDGFYEYIIENEEAIITSCNSSLSGEITIPSTLGGCPVTAIGEWAFASQSSITALTLPESLTTIGERSFHYCTGLTKISIPDSVTTIGPQAFDSCHALTEVTIGSGVTAIGANAFSACVELSAFLVDEDNPAYCSDLYGVLFNKDQTTLIQAPAKLYYNYTVPAGVTEISNAAFQYCQNLPSVTLPDTVTVIGENAFYGCASLTGIYVDRGNPVYSSDDCGVLFSKDKTTLIQAPAKLSGSYTLPDGVITVSAYAFFQCSDLSCLTISDSVTTLGTDAFAYCMSLTDVTIGSSVITIDDHAFYFCNALTEVVLPDSVTTIGDYAFQSCNELASVTMGNHITYIGQSAFQHCNSLTELTLPAGLTAINPSAFSGCYSMKTIHIPATVTAIGDYAFQECAGLTDVYFGGTEFRWNKITMGYRNDYLTNATLHFTPAPVGDLDTNAGITEDDALYLLRHLLLPDLFEVDQDVDFDKNGSTNEDDVIYLLQHILMPKLFPL